MKQDFSSFFLVIITTNDLDKFSQIFIKVSISHNRDAKFAVIEKMHLSSL